MLVRRTTDEVAQALYKVRDQQSDQDMSDLRFKLKKLKVCLQQANKKQYSEAQDELCQQIGAVLATLEYKA